MKTKTSASYVGILFIACAFTVILQLAQSTVIVLSYLTQAVKDMYVRYYDQTQELSFILEYIEEPQDISEFEMVAIPVESSLEGTYYHKLGYALELVEAGMSQRGAAKLVGVPQTAISRAINGVKR